MRFLLLLVVFVNAGHLAAQTVDSTAVDPCQFKVDEKLITKEVPGIRHPGMRMRNLVIPLSLITYGVISQASEDMREFDVNIKSIARKDADFHTTIDNYLQYAPGLSVYALNAAGIKGKNNFRDRTTIYLLSNLIMGIAVQSIKKATKEVRPEGYRRNAFPSGHTATAFAGAEFLRQEYKDVSPWYGIAGYAAATTTGILRIYNNKHWFRDVVAGAGFGILATEAAYCLEPVIARKLFHRKTKYHFDPASF
ncbi:MAG: phosphatase PAP2 family protein [Chitinophagaceae bacterium]